MKIAARLAPGIVKVFFGVVLLGVAVTVIFAGREGQRKDAAALLVFQETSTLEREAILACLARSRPTTLNLSPPEHVNSLFLPDNYGSFGPLSLRHDDLQNPARHIVVRVVDNGAIRNLNVWTRRDIQLRAADISVLKNCV